VIHEQPPYGERRLATIRLPGGGRLGVYEARHATAFDL
jgi:hypothetical protein